MADPLSRLAAVVSNRLAELQVTGINRQVLKETLRVIHSASLITEEGRYIQGSITLSNPQQPDSPPKLQRADYPRIHPLGDPITLTPAALAKLARAVHRWAGSIAVWGNTRGSISAWGIVDQLANVNTRLHLEREKGFGYSGIATINIDRPGELSVYHGRIFLGALRSQQVILCEPDALRSDSIVDRLIPVFQPYASATVDVLRQADLKCDDDDVLAWLLERWAQAIARICMSIRREGTGGALVVTSDSTQPALSGVHYFDYNRLASAIVLHAIDYAYVWKLRDKISEDDSIKNGAWWDLRFGDEDLADREHEVNGAVKLVASLAAMDGAVVLRPDLSVVGFGAKIGGVTQPARVVGAEQFQSKGKKANAIDVSHFGTRHASMIRLCQGDPSAIGVVVSQDGHVRITTKEEACVVLWDNVRLLDHATFSDDVCADSVRMRRRIGKRKKSREYGYSVMPKSVVQLLRREFSRS